MSRKHVLLSHPPKIHRLAPPLPSPIEKFGKPGLRSVVGGGEGGSTSVAVCARMARLGTLPQMGAMDQ